MFSLFAAESGFAIKVGLNRWTLISVSKWEIKLWQDLSEGICPAYHTGTHQLHPHSPSGHRRARRWKCSSHWGRQSGLPHTWAHGILGYRKTEKKILNWLWEWAMNIGLLCHMGCSVVVLVIISPLVDVSLQKLNETPAVFHLQPNKWNSCLEVYLIHIKSMVYCIFIETDKLSSSSLLFPMLLTHNKHWTHWHVICVSVNLKKALWKCFKSSCPWWAVTITRDYSPL